MLFGNAGDVRQYVITMAVVLAICLAVWGVAVLAIKLITKRLESSAATELRRREEALGWLQGTDEPHAFAPDRFGKTAWSNPIFL